MFPIVSRARRRHDRQRVAFQIRNRFTLPRTGYHSDHETSDGPNLDNGHCPRMKNRTPVSNTGLGITFGAGVGVVVGVLVGGKALPIAIAIGAGLGVVFGSALGARKKRPK